MRHLRVRNESKRQYTRRPKSPLIEGRLDFVLVSNILQSLINKANIINAICTEHSAIKSGRNYLQGNLHY